MSYRDMKPVIKLRQYYTPMHSSITQVGLNFFFNLRNQMRVFDAFIYPSQALISHPHPASRQFNLLQITKESGADLPIDHSYLRERLRPNPELLKWLHICSLNSTTSLVGSGLKTQTNSA